MPTILVDRDDFYRLVGDDYRPVKLEDDLELVKGEDKGVDPVTGLLRIELNDTNRPDLWSAAGIARQIRARRRGKVADYAAFTAEPGDKRIVVDTRAQRISVIPASKKD